LTDPAIPARTFTPFSKADWRRLAEAGLNGANFERTLVSHTYDGIRIEPVYERAEGATLKSPRGAQPWLIVQRVDHPDPEKANRQALTDLGNGATGLTLVFCGAPTARGYGLQTPELAAMEQMLHNVLADHIHLRLEAGRSGFEAAALLVAVAKNRGYDFSTLDWSLGLDPVGAMIGTGDAGDGIAPALTRMADTIHDLAADGFGGQAALADGRPWHEAGASEAEELACVLATAVLYLRTLEKSGFDLDAAWAQIGFAIAIDPDQFLGLAKIRALVMLLQQVARSCGIEDPAAPRIHGESDWRSQTRFDPHVNILRGTMATFVAGIGGATSFTVLPFTSALGLADNFARRVARNTQLVLMEESNLARVSDPLAGSGYGEDLTGNIAREAWTLFQKIEAAGGIVAALDDGWLQEAILETAESRAKNMAHGKETLTGTSSFPNLLEKEPTVLKVEVSSKHLTSGSIDLPEGGTGERFSALVHAIGNGEKLQLGDINADYGQVTPLPSLRLAEPFEYLRVRAGAVAKGGERPTVFQAGLGPISGLIARANWTRNLFAIAGIDAVLEADLADPEKAVAAFRKSGARVACICGPDDLYGQHAAAFASALKAAGATLICLAGRPGDLQDVLTKAGIGIFLHAGCDMIASLEQVLADYDRG
jgi:methylmalonyl-CoA mutase